jgi:PTS system nitrogen regulatory IIA component
MLYHLSDYQKGRTVELEQFFNEHVIQLGGSASDIPALQQRLADAVADVFHLDPKTVLKALQDQHVDGFGGLGHGVAVPHVRLPEIEKLESLLMILNKPVDVDAVDRIPVDVIFFLLVPEHEEGDHLRALAKLSRLLRSEELCNKLRGCKTEEAAYVLLAQAHSEKAA